MSALFLSKMSAGRRYSLSVHKLYSRKVRVNTRKTVPAGKYVSMQNYVSEGKEINL